MDIDDLKKIFKRKRVIDDSETLREKLSQETSNIIQLRVSQDAAYWDLRERLDQAENQNKCLQRNIADLQTQYEYISGQYQEELRLRPELFNKTSSTRKISDVLERYCERLKETLSRCRADQAKLFEAFQASTLLLKDVQCKLEQEKKKHEQILDEFREKEKLKSEQQTQMIKFLTTSKQKLDSELADLRETLTSMQVERDELKVTVRNLNAESEMKEQFLASLQDEMKMKNEEYNKYLLETQNTIAKQESELKIALETTESLKHKISCEEQTKKIICDEKSALQMQISVLQKDCEKQAADMEALRTEMKEKEEKTSNIIQKMINEKRDLQKEMQDMQQMVKIFDKLLPKCSQETRHVGATVATNSQKEPTVSTRTRFATAKIQLVQAEKEDDAGFIFSDSSGGDLNDTPSSLPKSGKQLENERVAFL